jgi:Tfp pilus assembly protein PilF
MRFNLALAYIGAEEFDQAEAALLEVLKVDPSYWEAYHKLGEVFIAQDDKEGAQVILTQLLERNPDYEERDSVESLVESL